MASSMKFLLILFFACSLFFDGTSGAKVICEKLGKKLCAFGISSSGKRCLLEKYKSEETGKLVHTCKTSEVVVHPRLSGHIETDKCVAACGVDRRTVGISSDALLDPKFTLNLCSRACYHNCPNIVDLYFNLAAAEGVYLPTICKKQRSSPKRAIFGLFMSSGAVVDKGVAPSPKPSPEKKY